MLSAGVEADLMGTCLRAVLTPLAVRERDVVMRDVAVRAACSSLRRQGSVSGMW